MRSLLTCRPKNDRNQSLTGKMTCCSSLRPGVLPSPNHCLHQVVLTKAPLLWEINYNCTVSHISLTLPSSCTLEAYEKFFLLRVNMGKWYIQTCILPIQFARSKIRKLFMTIDLGEKKGIKIYSQFCQGFK